jgi:hypothetical protein
MTRSEAVAPRIERGATPRSVAFVGVAVLVSALVVAAPPVLAAAVLAVFGALVLVLVRPLTGVFLLTLVQAIGSVKAVVRVGLAIPMDFYLFDAVSLLLLLVLVLRFAADRHSDRSRLAAFAEERWIWFFLAAFVAWTGFKLLGSEHLLRDFLGQLRIDGNFVLMVFTVRYLDDYRACLKLMAFYCAVAVVFCAAAIYSSYWAVNFKNILHAAPGWSIASDVTLFNMPAGFNPLVVGLVPGHGLTAKHELGMLLSGAVVFALLLLRHHRSPRVRLLLVLCILLYETIIHQAFIKLSIAGTFLILGLLCVAVVPWRRRVVAIMAGLIVLNLTGFFAAKLVAPSHMQKIGSTLGTLEKTASRSRYQFGSIAQRADLWQRSFQRVLSSYGLGRGPDSLRYDLSFDAPVAHNWLLNTLTDYGVVPALFIVAALLAVAQRVYRRVFSRIRVDSGVWLLQLGCSFAVASTLFEYSFDCFLWWPQLWFMLGLLLAVLRFPVENGETRARCLYSGASARV